MVHYTDAILDAISLAMFGYVVWSVREIFEHRREFVRLRLELQTTLTKLETRLQQAIRKENTRGAKRVEKMFRKLTQQKGVP